MASKIFQSLLFLIILAQTAQSQYVNISSTVPAEVTVCGASDSMYVWIKNETASTLTNNEITIALPTGIIYDASSLVEFSSYSMAEIDVTNNANLRFSLNDISVNDSAYFAITYRASEPSIGHQEAGNTFRNDITLSHDGGSKNQLTNAYNILFAALNITNVSPINQDLKAGETFDRSITVVNAGFGSISAFIITDVKDDNSAFITAVDIGTLSVTGDSIIISGSDFSGIGNGDAFFDQNESITITETYGASGCNAITVNSVINAHWGCDESFQSTANDNASINVSFKAPNVALSSSSNLSACFANGAASNNQITLQNNGQGIAKDVVLDLYKSINGGYDEDLLSKIDTNSFYYSIDGGTQIAILPSQTFATRNDGDYACLGSDPTGRILLNLPDIEAGAKIDVYFDMYHCNPNVCNGNKIQGWEFAVTNTDGCDSQTYNTSRNAESPEETSMTIFTETPADIDNGNTETFTYTISSHSNTLPEETGAHYEMVFTLPAGLIFDGGGNDLIFRSGPNVWNAIDVIYNSTARTVTARYALPETFSIPKSEIQLNLRADCSQPGAISGNVDIVFDVNYVVDSTCSTVNKIPFVCNETVTTDLNCPSGACEGMQFNQFTVERTSFGSPDNDQDGLPDASGNLNQNEIRKNRVMYGDTLRTVFYGKINSTGANQWDYGYAESTIELGANLTLIDAFVIIYDVSANAYYTCSNVQTSSTLNGSDQTFDFNFSASTLSSTCNDLIGYQFEDGDSIWLYGDYKVTGNIGGAIQEVTVTNEYYVSTIANPVNTEDKDQCNDYGGTFTIIGYYFENSKRERYTINKCTRVVSQNYYLSIGDCCSNFAGGDLFPYEYRNWGHLKEATIEIPPFYEIVNIYFRQLRTKHTNSTVTETVNPISYESFENNIISLNLEQHYIGHGGTIINPSDDGFNGTVYVELAPTCDVPDNTFQDITWQIKFAQSAYLGGGDTGWISASQTDRIRFRPTDLNISSSQPTVDGLARTATWEVDISNPASNTDAHNAWLHLKNPSGVMDIVSVVDQSTGLPLTQSSDIYEVGSILRNNTATLDITARYYLCSVDQLFAYTGYECAGYPVNFDAFKCNISDMVLKVEPKPGDLQAKISGEYNGACSDELTLTVEVASVKTAYVDSIKVGFTLPSNGSITYSNNSSAFKYPITDNFNAITDPTQNGLYYEFDILDFNQRIDERALPGVLDLDSNRFQIQFDLALENTFAAGDFVQVSINGEEICDVDISTINLEFDPNIKFEKNLTSNLSLVAENNWSIAWIDYDNDGFEDVYVTNYDVNENNILYKNNGNGTFSQTSGIGEIITDLGSSISSTWADYDNDGDIDAFVANNIGTTNNLYQNNGDGTFTKVDSMELTDYYGYCHNAAWADYDNDGYVDLFVTEYMPTQFNLLYHNNGDGTFTKVTNNPMSFEAAHSIGATWADYDNDGDVDLYVPNTEMEANSLYRNDGDGNFTKITSGAIVTDVGSSVGSSWGDYDNDGDLDLFVANSGQQNNRLYQNNGDGTFTSITNSIVTNSGGHSHGSAWGDIDSDGDLDLMVTNDQNSTNFLYINNGDGTFATYDNIITSEEANSFATAFGDYDNDGDIDLFVSNRTQEANDFFTNSRGSCSSWSCFKLIGTRSNASAIGAKVRVKATIDGVETWQMREVSAQTGGGAGSQNSLKVFFGLDDATLIDSVIIEWPSGITEILTNVAINNCNTLTEIDGTLVSGKAFIDANENCTYDQGEVALSGIQVALTPGPIYAYTDSAGNYSIYVSPETYNVQANLGSNWEASCPPDPTEHDIIVTGAGGESFTNLDFPVKAKTIEADVQVTIGNTPLRRGFRNIIVLTYENLGAIDAENTVISLPLDDDVIPLFSEASWNDGNEGGTIVGNTFTWNIGTVPVGGQGYIYVTDSVNVNATLAAQKTFTATVSTTSSESILVNNTDSFADSIVGAVDPNDKLVFPKGYGDEGLISFQDTLTYKIRFQNVGNYPAKRVVVVDILSEHLDHGSIHDIRLSHPGNYTLKDGIFKAIFNDIELPDSTSNEPESHGYISFKILPKASSPNESVILNRANIQFDFNEYIVTNTVRNTIVNGLHNRENLPLIVYPNPVDGDYTVEVGSPRLLHLPSELHTITIHNLSGLLVKTYRNNSVGKVYLNKEDLDVGMYIINGIDKYGFKYTGKFVVR